MSLRLKEAFESVIGRDDEFIEMTQTMAMVFTDKDRTVLEAKLKHTGPDDPAYLVMRVGLRSEILKGFPRFSKEREGRYLPCDIPSLVPVIGIMSSARMKGLEGTIICEHEPSGTTHVIFTFKGEADTRNNLDDLAARVMRVMERWRGWTDVLLHILDRDPNVGNWSVDWREFLAGESGFVTMPWFSPMSLAERTEALDSIVNACRALLTSFLTPQEMRSELVLDLLEWLDTVEPQPAVSSVELPHVTEVV